MGIKGRRVHMIEELSETIISFQRVNPGAKERLVQITGPAEDKINYAKQLIEDTIRRNASPVRLDPNMASSHTGGGGGGSCSSLASSNSDEPVQPRTPGASSLSNRLSFNSAQNFMTAAAASQQMVHLQQQQQQHMANIQQAMQTSTPVANAAVAAAAAGKTIRPHSQMLLHSYSTNDASLGEYKFTCNVGQHVIKITGDCCELVRIAKLVLDDHFSSAEFLASIEAGAAFDTSPISTPTTPMTGAPQFANPLHAASPMATDSGIGLNYMNSNNNQDNDDDVFFPDSNNLSKSASQSNGLARSRRSHFSRKDSTPEAAANTANAAILRQKSETGNNNNTTTTETTRIVHQYEHLLYYAKSPHSWALPSEWQKICDKFPAIIRNKVTTSTTTSTTTHASSSTATITNNLTTTTITTTTNNNSNCFTSTSSTTTSPYSPITNPSCYSYQNSKASNSTLTLRVACNSNNSSSTAAANAPSSSSCNQQNMFNSASTNATTFTTNTNIANNLNLTTTNNSNNFLKNSSYNQSTTSLHNNIQQSCLLASTNNVTNNISTLPPSHLTHNNSNNNNLSNSFNQTQHQNNNNNNSCSNQVYYKDGNNINNTSNKSLECAANNSLTYKLNSHHGSLALNIRRKGFFNRLTYSIDEDGIGGAGHYEIALKTPELTATAPATSANTTQHHHHHQQQQSQQTHHNLTNANNASINVTAGSGRIHSAGLNRHLNSVRTGPMASVPLTTITNTDTRQKLLNKQIKIISDIMVESSKCSGAAVTNKSNENLKSFNDNMQLTKNPCQVPDLTAKQNVEQGDDDDEVEIVAVTSAANNPPTEVVNNSTTVISTSTSSSTARPKLNYEFRSYSTCD